jgi:ribonuclease P protein component
LIRRVRDRATFVALRRDGIRARRGPLRATLLAGDGDDLHLAFALPRRVGTAVVRNRLRRRLRAIVADLEADPDARCPRGALLIGADPEAVGRTTQELRNDVQRLFTALADRLGSPA